MVVEFAVRCKGLHILYRGYGLEIFTKVIKKVLVRSEEHDKTILATYTTAAKKFVSRMLTKFFPLSQW